MHEQTDIYFIIIHVRNGRMNKLDPFEKQSHEQKKILIDLRNGRMNLDLAGK